MLKVPIQIMSDLHLESPSSSYETFTITPKAPNLALLGDIGQVRNPELLLFLSTQLTKFKIVFFLLGNHEPYKSNWATAKQKLLDFHKESVAKQEQDPTLGKFIFLDQTRYDLSPTETILGCTLFSKILNDQAPYIMYSLNDFHQIKDWSVTKHREAFASDLKWLNEQVTKIREEEPNRKIMIFTHYGPTIDQRVVDPENVGSQFSSAFLTDLRGEQCWESENVRLWAFGHTHYNCDFWDVGSLVGRDEIRVLRVVTEQRGYAFKQADDFEGGKVVSL